MAACSSTGSSSPTAAFTARIGLGGDADDDCMALIPNLQGSKLTVLGKFAHTLTVRSASITQTGYPGIPDDAMSGAFTDAYAATLGIGLQAPAGAMADPHLFFENGGRCTDCPAASPLPMPARYARACPDDTSSPRGRGALRAMAVPTSAGATGVAGKPCGLIRPS